VTVQAPDDFSTARQWADAYRAHGLAVVPGSKDKKPYSGWKEFQDGGIPDAAHSRWYAKDGEHARNYQMGFICGAAFCDENYSLLVVDLDEKPDLSGRATWHAWLADHENGLEPETWTARTGGGGTHLYFRYPRSRVVTNTQASMPGVDIRAQGGFIVAPPSRHQSGKQYTWEIAPWDTDLADAPEWLLEIIGTQDAKAFETTAAAPREKTLAPEQSTDAWGHIIDGRDAYMRDVVWGAVVDWYRDCPIPPSPQESEEHARDAFKIYAERVRPQDHRLTLDDEGRGWDAFWSKWQYAVERWESKVAVAATHDKPREPSQDAFSAAATKRHSDDDGETFRTLDLIEIDQLPPPKWLIENVMPDAGLTFLYGAPGKGKSFVTLDIALHIAHGCGDWHGHKAESGPVVYVAGEGVGGFKKRVKAWHQHHGIAADHETPFRLLPVAPNMLSKEQIDKLVLTITRKANGARLIVIDTLARAAAGADENDAKEMGLFVSACDFLRDETGAAILLVHHSGKDEDRGLRGSSSLNGAADCVLHLKRQGEDMITLLNEKQKDGEQIAPLRFKSKQVQWTEGLTPADSIVITSTDETANKPTIDKNKARRMLDRIREAWDSGEPLTPHRQKSTEQRYAPRIFSRELGADPNETDRLIIEWIDNAIVAVETVDAHTKKRGLKVIGSID
jgi:hypothetical protein